MNRCSVLYKSSLLGLLRRRVTKQSEVCHWIVSADQESRRVVVTIVLQLSFCSRHRACQGIQRARDGQSADGNILISLARARS